MAKFEKGKSGNPKGRPKKVTKNDSENRPFNEPLFTEIVDKAKGDGVKLTQLMLEKAYLLGTLPSWVKDYLKIARDISNYQHSKKASIETKVSEFRRIEFHMVMPETYNQLDAIYKKKPELIAALPEDKLIDVTSGKVEPELVIEAVNYAVKATNDEETDSNT